MKNNLQTAISLAVENHPGLAEKAFIETEAGWAIRKNICDAGYSHSEQMLVGLLLELYRRRHGLIDFDWDKEVEPSEYLWKGVKAAADLIERVDPPQQKVIQALFGR